MMINFLSVSETLWGTGWEFWSNKSYLIVISGCFMTHWWISWHMAYNLIIEDHKTGEIDNSKIVVEYSEF